MQIDSPITVIASSEGTSSTVAATKNDNSNPQQGTGSMVTGNVIISDDKSKSDSSGGSGKAGSRGALNSTKGMKCPPTKKDSRKLFVGGLPSDVTEEEFHTFFNQFGEVVDSVVMFDRETGRSRGFGFVTFQDTEVADTLLSKNEEGDDASTKLTADAKKNGVRVGRLVMRGKTCEVKAAEPKETKSSRRTYQTQAGGGGTSRVAPVDRRFVNKMYNAADERHGAATHHGAFDPAMHNANAVAAQYPMGTVPMNYYHPHYAGMHAGYMHPMYAPMQPMQHHAQSEDGSFSPLVGTQMDYSSGIYMDGHDGMHAHPYYYPLMMNPGHPNQPNHQNYSHNKNGNTDSQSTISGGQSSSVMQPTAPGIPTKDDGIV